LTNERGPNLALDFIKRNYNPRCKLVMYGFSAGGKQVLDLCRKIEQRNIIRPEDGSPPIKVAHHQNLCASADAFPHSQAQMNRAEPILGDFGASVSGGSQ
jgi:hypothetical protein